MALHCVPAYTVNCLFVASLAGQPLPRCQLPLWHAPARDGTEDSHPPGVQAGFISAAGHVYACDHDSCYACFHSVLVIDRSGSMSDRQVQPTSPEVRQFMREHELLLDNVAGVACEAALAYMRTRQAKNSSDSLSCITFNRQTTVAAEGRVLASPAECSLLLHDIMKEVRSEMSVCARLDALRHAVMHSSTPACTRVCTAGGKHFYDASVW